MSFKIAVILAEGFEEVEAIAPIDVMRRAGLEVVLVGLTSKMVKASHGLVVQADLLLSELHGLPDAIVLPGGLPGAKYLGESKEVKQLVQKMNESKKWVTAICASPALVLAPAGVLNQKKATCYPGFEKNFSSEVTFSHDRVVVDGNIITSRGPGSALEFGLKLVEQFCGPEKAKELKEALLVKV